MEASELSKYKDVEMKDEQDFLVSDRYSILGIEWDLAVKIQPEKEEDKVINFLAVYLKPNPKYSFQ